MDYPEDKEGFVEFIARTLIVQEDKVLLCRVKGNEHWFFPGGHVIFGEYAEDALRREFMEEIGANLTDIKMIGLGENIFEQRGVKRQEINMIYSARLEEGSSIEALEGHMEFKWADVANLSEENILPEGIKSSVLKWMEDKKFFYSRQ